MEGLEDRLLFHHNGFIHGPGTMLDTFGPFATSIMLGGPGAAQILSGQTGFDNPFANVANIFGENPFTLDGALATLGFTPPRGTGIAPDSTALLDFISGTGSLVNTFPVTSSLVDLAFTSIYGGVNAAYQQLGLFGSVPSFSYNDLFSPLWGGSWLPFSASGNSSVQNAVDGASSFDLDSFESLLDATGKYEFAWAQSADGDFNSDGDSDFVWRNYLTGENVIALMDGSDVESIVSLPAVPNVQWVLASSSDMNGDGDCDLVWRNQQTGANTAWLMDGTKRTKTLELPKMKGTSWVLEGSADFNGDRRGDLVWRNYKTGKNSLWTMGKNGKLSKSQSIKGVSDPNWILAGAGNFDGNTNPDLVWHNHKTGQNQVWRMKGASISSKQNLPKSSDRGLAISGVADLDGDGRDDLIFRDVDSATSSGSVVRGKKFASTQRIESPVQALGSADVSLTKAPVLNELGQFLTTSQEAFWTMSGAADFDRDGDEDILYRNYATGENRLWFMDGTEHVDTLDLPAIDDLADVIDAVGDFDGDRTSDILFRNYRTGENRLYFLGGDDVTSLDLPAVSDPSWTCAGSGYFNDDSTADLLWFSTSSGESLIWFMDTNGAPAGQYDLPAEPNPSAFISGTGDFNGDGYTDILWRDYSDRSNYVWITDPSGPIFVPADGQSDLNWFIAGTGDFNADGNADILWQNYDRGDRAIWLMDGTTAFDVISLVNDSHVEVSSLV
jgi:hypothetical protein